MKELKKSGPFSRCPAGLKSLPLAQRDDGKWNWPPTMSISLCKRRFRCRIWYCLISAPCRFNLATFAPETLLTLFSKPAPHVRLMHCQVARLQNHVSGYGLPFLRRWTITLAQNFALAKSRRLCFEISVVFRENSWFLSLSTPVKQQA
jgi:hypothetical protein